MGRPDGRHGSSSRRKGRKGADADARDARARRSPVGIAFGIAFPIVSIAVEGVAFDGEGDRERNGLLWDVPQKPTRGTESRWNRGMSSQRRSQFADAGDLDFARCARPVAAR
jgi:hypothetical protein